MTNILLEEMGKKFLKHRMITKDYINNQHLYCNWNLLYSVLDENNINTQDKFGKTIVHYVVENDLEFGPLIMSKFDFTLRDQNGLLVIQTPTITKLVIKLLPYYHDFAQNIIDYYEKLINTTKEETSLDMYKTIVRYYHKVLNKSLPYEQTTAEIVFKLNT
jgi:hypothetical protein